MRGGLRHNTKEHFTMTDPTPAPAAQPVVVTNAPVPGRSLGIAGLIIDFFIPILGLILSIVAKVQSGRANVRNTPATVGIVLGIIFTIGYVILIIVLAVGAGALASECATLGSGVHHVNGVTYTCS
jgi:hypothetical protein